VSTTGTLAAFAATVAVAFGGAAAVGSAVGPISVGTPSSHNAHGNAAATALPRGLARSSS